MDHRSGPTNETRTAGTARILLDGRATGGAFGLVEIEGDVGSGPPRHRHADEDEVLYVVRGVIDVDVAGARTRLEAGGCILLPRGSEHAYRVVSSPAALLVIVTPAGLETCFASDIWSGDDLERLIAVAAGFGVEITGEPLRHDDAAPCLSRRSRAAQGPPEGPSGGRIPRWRSG